MKKSIVILLMTLIWQPLAFSKEPPIEKIAEMILAPADLENVAYILEALQDSEVARTNAEFYADCAEHYANAAMNSKKKNSKLSGFFKQIAVDTYTTAAINYAIANQFKTNGFKSAQQRMDFKQRENSSLLEQEGADNYLKKIQAEIRLCVSEPQKLQVFSQQAKKYYKFVERISGLNKNDS